MSLVVNFLLLLLSLFDVLASIAVGCLSNFQAHLRLINSSIVRFLDQVVLYIDRQCRLTVIC